MRCEEVMELIQRNLDGDLSSESANMHEHLRSCQECQSLHESLSHLSLDLENLPDIEPPISIVDRILPQLEVMNQAGSISVVGMHQAKAQQGPLLWKRWALAAGSAAAVLFIWLLADNLWTPEWDQLKIQMQSATDKTSNSASSPDPALEQSAHPEVAKNRSLDIQPEQAAENKIMPSVDSKQPALKEKQASPSPKKDAVVLESAPDRTNRKDQPGSSKLQSTDQEAADQQLALAPQEKTALEQMPSIAAILPPNEEETTPPPLALAPQESAEMIQTFMAPELSDTKEAASRGEVAYPSPGGEWVAQMDVQTIVIIDQGGVEVFRSHSWPAEMEVKVEWLEEQLLQYTLTLKTDQEKKDLSFDAETWRINIQDRLEQKL